MPLRCTPDSGGHPFDALCETVGHAAPPTRNELTVSLITECESLQAGSSDADFLLVDPSYGVGKFDEVFKERAQDFLANRLAETPRANPTRRNFSSRIYFVLADLLQRGYLYYAQPVWDTALRPAFITRLSASGHELATNSTELRRLFPVPRNDLCFVIMSFSGDKRLADFYRLGIKTAIEESRFECIRAEEIEHRRRITDPILQQIEASRFLVADLTEPRPNCYYELGWAHHAGKDVILTINSSTPIHFDVNKYDFIVYESASELHDRLTSRIQETIGYGKNAACPRPADAPITGSHK